MIWFARKDGTWTQTSSLNDEGMIAQITADDETTRPSIRVLQQGRERLHLSGVPPKANTDTTHTVSWLNPEGSAENLFAVHAQSNNLIFEDLRSAQRRDETDAALDQVQSALNEILIPVYIDDVITDLSESLSGVLVLHTAQYEDQGNLWTYFRAASFENGNVGFEVERGTL